MRPSNLMEQKKKPKYSRASKCVEQWSTNRKPNENYSLILFPIQQLAISYPNHGNTLHEAHTHRLIKITKQKTNKNNGADSSL